MHRLLPTVLFCAILVVGCSSGIDAEHLNSMSEGEAQQAVDNMSEDELKDLVEDAASSGRCEDTELQENIPWQKYMDDFVAFGNQAEETPDPEMTQSAYQMLETNLADIYAQTPAGGQGDYARIACDITLKFAYAGRTEVVVESPMLIAPGYAACLQGPSATAPVESFLSEEAEGGDPKLTAEMNLIAVDLADATADTVPLNDAAFVHLCPQIDHNPPDPDRAEKLSSMREQVEARARELGVCGEIEGGAPEPQRVFVHKGTMGCSEAEALIKAGLDKVRSESLKTATVDGAQCSGVAFGDYDSSNFDYSFACYKDDGTVVGLAAQPQG